MILFARSFLLILLFALTSCGGTADKDVRYIPIEKTGGRICSIQCQHAADACDQSCNFTYRTCVNKLQTEALKDYEAYTRERIAARAKVEKRPSDFEKAGACEAESCYRSCREKHVSCYEDCGGEVQTKTSCLFFCF